MPTEVSFDYKKMRRLEKAYKVAVDDGQDTFVFEGVRYVTTFTKYMLEYLYTKLTRTEKVII